MVLSTYIKNVGLSTTCLKFIGMLYTSGFNYIPFPSTLLLRKHNFIVLYKLSYYYATHIFSLGKVYNNISQQADNVVFKFKLILTYR